MPGFLLHHTLRYIIPTLSLLSRVFCFTHGCLPHPSSKYFTPHTSGIFRVSASPTGVCLTHRQNILPRIPAVYSGCLPHPRVSASPIIQIFYPDFESFMPGFLLHHTLRYFIPTLSLLRRVFILTHGCLPHPSSKYFIPTLSLLRRVFILTHGCLPHPSSKYFIPTLSLLCRVFCFTIHSDILSRL